MKTAVSQSVLLRVLASNHVVFDTVNVADFSVFLSWHRVLVGIENDDIMQSAYGRVHKQTALAFLKLTLPLSLFAVSDGD